MLTEQNILSLLDKSNDGWYCHFVDLDEGYSYLIDSRVNVFRNDNNQWAIAIERLGYNPRAGTISLDIWYYGNCLINLEQYNNHPTNNYTIWPIERDTFFETIKNEDLKPDAKFWIVRGKKVKLSLNKQDYINAGVSLNKYTPNAINVEEAARLIIITESKLFRATDEELYKSIPKELNKILVLDEWYHRQFYLLIENNFSDEFIASLYTKGIADAGISFETLYNSVIHQEETNRVRNKEIWGNDRPSCYETWQQIAKVIVTGKTEFYKPTLKPNSHWKFHPESGSL